MLAAVLLGWVGPVAPLEAVTPQKAPSPVVLKTMSGFRGPTYTSVIFQFNDAVSIERPVVRNREVFLRLKNAVTRLSLSQRYKTYDSWVWIEPSGKISSYAWAYRPTMPG